jgi:dihydropteroate synthase
MVKDTFFRKKQSINCGGKYLDLTTPRIMGILNLTPDSFYDGGKFITADQIVRQVNKMLNEGADIIDIGAYSSRPGAKDISAEKEYARLAYGLEIIRKKFPESILSVDTFRSEIARKAIHQFRVNLVNDIAGGQLDPDMYESLIELQVPYILMHMPGNPQTMQQKTEYRDLPGDIIIHLGNSVELLKSKGLHDIIIDPGFGFGKTLDQNYRLLATLDAFQMLELPLLVGLSRKSMICNVLNTTPDGALNGTSALHMTALEKGASIIRVHDVAEARQVIQLFLKTREQSEKIKNHAL